MFGLDHLQKLQWLRTELAALVKHASRNRDPDLYAEVLLDNLPDDVSVEMLIPFLVRDDWWQHLSNFDSGVIPYFGWFTQFREATLELIAGDSGSRPTSGTAPTRPPSVSVTGAPSRAINAADFSQQQTDTGTNNNE